MLRFLKRNAGYDKKSGCGHETKMLTPFYRGNYGVLSPARLGIDIGPRGITPRNLALRLGIDIGPRGITPRNSLGGMVLTYIVTL